LNKDGETRAKKSGHLAMPASTPTTKPTFTGFWQAGKTNNQQAFSVNYHYRISDSSSAVLFKTFCTYLNLAENLLVRDF
jgi:hypothetical protein